MLKQKPIACVAQNRTTSGNIPVGLLCHWKTRKPWSNLYIYCYFRNRIYAGWCNSTHLSTMCSHSLRSYYQGRISVLLHWISHRLSRSQSRLKTYFFSRGLRTGSVSEEHILWETLYKFANKIQYNLFFSSVNPEIFSDQQTLKLSCHHFKPYILHYKNSYCRWILPIRKCLLFKLGAFEKSLY
jgi:hypothetical protein